MRIAHLSDPHVLNLDGVGAARLVLNKRLTGWVNLKLHRGAVHRFELVEAMMDDLRQQRVDHVVITGDVSNLALDEEFDLARTTFRRLGMDPGAVSLVPGNHDLYTHGAQRERRFASFFREHLTCDLGLATPEDHPSGPFPYVRLRGPVAIVGVSTAVARPPLVASGHAGERQLALLARALHHPEVARRLPVVLLHHPLVNPRSRLRTLAHGLAEAPALRRILDARPGALVLHGHLHDRVRRTLATTRGGTLEHLGATSASLLSHRPHRVAGYNLYDLDDPHGGVRVSARAWDAATARFVPVPVRSEAA